MKKSRFPFIITIIVLIFLYLPIIVLFINSFNDSRFGGEWAGFTWKWYERLLRERALWQSFRNSLIVALSATFASSILGTTAALALYRYKTRFQKAHYGLVYVPLVIPDILTGMSLLLLFMALNIKLGLFTVFITHTTFCLSYVTMVILARLQNFDFSIIEAAQDLGASSWTVFRKVLIPLLAPGIAAGAMLAFTLSIDDFVITFFVVGQGTTTLPIYIYSMIKYGSTPVINALSVILLIFTFIIIWLTQHLSEE
ncbi:Spermidine/putrescine transport system permease protein PotC [Neochlamydia sp. EPS4]|jgi:spermidine/putrescine transport system permease protein|uniref:ABC transporter permease n=1 Tax=unclassified Neochlamydia TaxID=2643326 RepID=UPI00057E62B6|nr:MULTISPECIES: ABC transporter permease [unclassified Neochlamydia]KIC73458.1 Spermidine/putrescine transport system permease protein PotC [Neochlamydia sp. EPS4]KIC76526.1 Spermidine/putrescine transport system permease protein PotC [Neochlamydia sp. TUME1]